MKNPLVEIETVINKAVVKVYNLNFIRVQLNLLALEVFSQGIELSCAFSSSGTQVVHKHSSALALRHRMSNGGKERTALFLARVEGSCLSFHACFPKSSEKKEKRIDAS